jgi:putative transposase
MKKTTLFTVKLAPTQQQVQFIEKHFSCVRIVYNHFVRKRIDSYNKAEEPLDEYHMSACLTGLKYREGYEFLREVNQEALLNALKMANKEYRRVITSGGTARILNDDFNEFQFRQNVRLENGLVSMPKFKEPVRYEGLTMLNANISRCTVYKTQEGEFYINVLIFEWVKK